MYGGKLTTDLISTDHARFFVYFPPLDDMADSATMIECGLFNTSYTVGFTFDNGVRDIQVRNKTRLNGVLRASQDGFESTRVVACVSIVAIVNSLFMTGIDNTVLTQTRELVPYFNDTARMTIENMSLAEELEQIMQNFTLSLFSGSCYLLERSLRIEENMLSVANLSLEKTRTAIQGPISIFSPQNEYQYSPVKLLVSYGVGLLCGAIIIIVGCVCIVASGVSFNISFSAILRTTRDPRLNDIVPAEETGGALPLSKGLGRVNIGFRHREKQASEAVSFLLVGDFYPRVQATEHVEDTEKTSSTAQARERVSFDMLLEREQHQENQSQRMSDIGIGPISAKTI